MIEDLKTLARAEPFAPFIIDIGPGTYPIDNPEDIKFTAGGSVWVKSNGEQFILNPIQITSIDLQLEREPPSESEIDRIRKWKQEMQNELNKKGFRSPGEAPESET